MKAEDEARIAEELRMEAEAKEQASLKAEEGAHFSEELSLKYEKD